MCGTIVRPRTVTCDPLPCHRRPTGH